MERPEEREAVGGETSIPKAVDLGIYEKRCLREHLLTVTIQGHEMVVWKAIEGLLWVKDQDTRELIPFRLRWAQKVLMAELCKQCLSGKPMRIDTLKARQLGFSTVIAAIFFMMGMFRPQTRWCVMADLESHASNIFDMYQTFYDNLDRSNPMYAEIAAYEHDNPGKRHPASIKPVLRNTRAGKMMRTENDSRIEIIVAGDTAGRSASYDGVHSSETAFQKNLTDTNVSLFSTVSIKNRNSIIIIETTANGYNAYKERWDMDSSGKSAFKALFIPWYDHPDYFLRTEGYGSFPQLEGWMYEKWREHPEVTKEQMLWYWSKYTEGYDEDRMKQEYPWDPSDAFISSGRSVFDMGKLKTRKDYLLSLGKCYEDGEFTCRTEYSPDGSTIAVSGVRFSKQDGGAFRIFEKPREGAKYVLICDPSKGMNYDYSAIQVICNNPVREVARYNAKEAIDIVAREIYCAGIYYNNALVSVENNTGSTILDLLLKMGYPSMYVDQNPVYNDFTQTYSRRYGHTTTVANRQPMIDSFVMAFRENPAMIWDVDTLTQMETFQMVMTRSNGGESRYKAMASGANSHDDLVMAFAPFWMVRSQQAFGGGERPKDADGVEIRSMADYNAYVTAKRREERYGKGSEVSNRLGIKW